MSAPDDGGNAFPHAQRVWDNDAQSWAVHSVGGMTLRDWMAGQALAGMLANQTLVDSAYECATQQGVSAAKMKAQYCYEHADAMIAARTPPTEKQA